ncbi:MAG: cation diffusion facilitator family transporter [Candidatus Dormibacteraceae bacterium]
MIRLLSLHHRHHHHSPSTTDSHRLSLSLALISGFMLVEVIASTLTHSLALFADAAHMLTDAGALLLSLIAMRLAARPPRGGLTYGLKRAEILSALVNGLGLWGLAGLIIWSAADRLLAPPMVNAFGMLGVTVAGIGINLLATWQLARADQLNLNLRASYQHLITDLYAFIGTTAAAVVILLTGWQRADPLISILVALLMIAGGWGVIWQAIRTLLEAAPTGMNPADVVQMLLDHPQVVNVHEFHLWEITSSLPALSAHVLVAPDQDCHAIRRDLEKLLATRLAITHTTLQVDHLAQPRPLQLTGRSG